MICINASFFSSENIIFKEIIFLLRLYPNIHVHMYRKKICNYLIIFSIAILSSTAILSRDVDDVAFAALVFLLLARNNLLRESVDDLQ